MRGRRPVVMCDGDGGYCGNWDVDFYTETASTVSGVQITSTERAPGWLTISDEDEDLCPTHAKERRGES
ncbi:MAG: hypothetical protein ACRDTJ_02375 [Pseudonocardiaceae bacterium]